MAQVVLKNVSKSFKGSGGIKEVVHNISFTCQDKEFVILVGPSGCGKSTTLRMIAGLEEVTSGEVLIDNQVVNEVPASRRDIAMVFQSYALYPHMTVYDNMAFGLRLRHFSRAEIDKRVKEAAEVLEIGPKLTKYPKDLSGGERQRVAVGRAIVRKPKVFLFDEPLSNLDAELRTKMRAELRQLHRLLNTTMIYVTHDQIEAMTMADRIVVMKKGEIHQFASPLDLYNRPANRFVAGFIGNQRMNFVQGSIAKKGAALCFRHPSFELKIPPRQVKVLKKHINAPVTMGIRPEDIYDKLFAKNATSGNTLKTKIQVMMPTGDHAILHLVIGEQLLTTKVTAYDRLCEGQRMDVVLDMNRALFFEPLPEKVHEDESQVSLGKLIC